MSTRTQNNLIVSILFLTFCLVGFSSDIEDMWRPCGIVGRSKNSGCVQSFDDSGTIRFMPDGQTIARRKSFNQIALQRLNAPLFSRSKTSLRCADTVYDIAISPDGEMLATYIGQDVKEVWIWNIGRQTLIRQMPVVSLLSKPDLKFSMDNRFLAANESDKVIVWDLSSWERTSFPNSILSAFSPDGTLIASLTRGVIAVRSIEGQQTISTFSVQEEHRPYYLTFSPDGSLVAANTIEGGVYVWKVKTGTLVTMLQQEASSLSEVAFAPDGRLLISGSTADEKNRATGFIYIWNTSDWSLQRKIKLGKGNYPKSIDISPNSNLLAIGTSDETMVLKIDPESK